MKTKRHIQTLAFTVLLLLVGGMTNGAWATVTYHILTNPITTYKYDGTVLRNNIRLEALRCTSSASTVGLPDDFKSPLAKNYTYYTTATITCQTIYDTTGAGDGKVKGINTQYDCYTDLGNTVSAGDAVGATTDIYVTYEYDESAATSLNIDLTGGKEYNVQLGNRFLCFNKDRANRPGAILSSNVTAENLSAEDFSYTKCDFSDKYHSFHFRFKFTGSDPYNITIMSAYDLETVFNETNNDNKSVVVKKQFKGSSLFSKMFNNMWLASDANKRWKGTSVPEADTMQGFYRGNNNEMNPIFDAFVLLNHTSGSGYVFVGSKMNTNGSTNQPNNNQYYYLTGNVNNGNNPQIQRKSAANADVTNLYEIKTYTYKVKTPLTGTVLTADMEWSDAMLSENVTDHIPDALKRKYVSYKAYSDENLENEITTFAQATSGVIWLKYEVTASLPFNTLASTSGTYDYRNAHWYTMRMNGKEEQKNIAYNSSNQLITGSESIGSESDIHAGEATGAANAQVAFVGDPYELKIISRAASETASATRYIGCHASTATGATLGTDMYLDTDTTRWEIAYESTDMDNFILRQFNTYTDPKYVGWSSTDTHPVTYSTTSSRIRVVDLGKVNYTYHVKNLEGNVAVKATIEQYIGTMLRTWEDIPNIIRSPFLAPSYNATVTYKNGSDNVITAAPYNTAGSNIYVTYNYSSPLSGGTFNVKLNEEYIYTSGTSINSQNDITSEQAGSTAYQWALNYSDPYNMTIKNGDNYVKVSWADNQALGWDTDESNASRFIAKKGDNDGTYEVMAATGDGVDASTTYYNIGRPTANTVQLYSKASYQSPNKILRFELQAPTATDITYRLIDMSKEELLQAKARQSTGDTPSFPPNYRSPLVSTYYYHTTEEHAKSYPTESDIATIDINTNTNIYVTYDVNDLVDLKAGTLYLLQYRDGESFKQEDGSDGVNPTAQKAIYPYVNGDGNFFVYGQEQYNLQQEGASSTRTRWAWYVESNVDGAPKGDPYHVKIKSRQTESYPITNSSEYNAYFMTYKPDGYSEVITTLGWPGMNSEAATEYMVLGSEGQYQLVTTNEISGSRYVVDSFEQYWKTFDTIRKKVWGDSKAKEDDDDPITIPNDTKYPYASPTEETLRHYLENTLGWHSYEKWAYAKRWNGYNNGYSSEEGTHEKKKGWEKIEHWYQTVNMGQGYFDFVKTSIDPVLILLDQHGFEIMRKPIPTSADDPERDAKLEAIRPYNSPMVKEYAFWATAKKRTGLHQYYALADRIGDDFTSTDLTNLPPYDSKNVKDKKGNQNDQYVTYIVKDEYAQTYTPSDKSAKPFLIEQGTKYASTDGSTITKNDVSDVTDMKTHILNDEITAAEEWYVKPNANIDIEMGYNDVSHTWTDPDPTDSKKWKNKNPNAYDHYKFKDKRVASYISDKVLTDSLGYFSFSNGFDPYNIQIESANVTATYMKTNANGAVLNEGSIIGSYPTTPGTVAMGDNTTTISPTPKWYDSRNLSVTNATFMAVQDAAGNMQLMPRFDHAKRMSEFGTLIAPTDAEVAKTYTKLYRPEVYEYLIIDNEGKESLRYKSGGDMAPQTPSHFKSPLATNFTYYSSASQEGDTYTIDKTKQIEESLDGATLSNNKIYVRYEYNEDADDLNMLQGKWLTMQLNEKDAKYDTGIKEGSSKPATIDADDKAWQWKFLETPQSTPDPYALYIYNRSQSAGTKAIDARYALLSHTSGGYALAVAGLGTANEYNYKYQFLNGNGTMSTDTPAANAIESGFTCTTGTFSETNSQVKLTDEVEHTFTYRVITNGLKYAIDATQSQSDVDNNGWEPVLPEATRTPLLNTEDYLYYNKDNFTITDGNITATDTIGKKLSYIYGLYDDEVYVRYTPYSDLRSSYKVPNVRNPTGSDPVARGEGSNDTSLGLGGTLLYNIIWYNDYMMKSDDDKTIDSDVDKIVDQDLQANPEYEWKLEGGDPYAIKIHSVGADGYIKKKADPSNECDLSGTSETATTFMLLNKDDYDYGVLTMTGSAITSQTPLMLSGYGNVLTTGAPTKFIPFALATYKVIYHLMIKNIGSEGVIIPYKGTETDDVLNPEYRVKSGTTLRDLASKDTEEGIAGETYQLGRSLRTIGTDIGGTHKGEGNVFLRDSLYCHDVGPISLGDVLEIPRILSRPNVEYDYYVEGVYNENGTANDDMNNIYKGQKVTLMGDNAGLLGKVVLINAVYNFMGGLDTNSGSDFVESVSQNKWYTYEANEATTKLAQYTGTLQTVSGYATHYTNDYLWTPVGDPYGFKMYNRYLHKNIGGTAQVMSSTNIAAEGITMVYDSNTPHLPANSVYELLADNTTTPGYFNVHPVVNKSGDQYYMHDNSGTIELSTTPTEWTFGLSEEVMKPYYQSAGYIGGLNEAGIEAYDTEAAKTNPLQRLMGIQDVVYNHDNDGTDSDHPNYIVHYTPGFYRLHSQPGSSGITTPRYMSGYTHKTELEYDDDSDPETPAISIPMHFYEVEEYDMNNPTFGDLESDQYTTSPATRGEIPLVTVTYDPASIFQFTGAAAASPSSTMQTQGLYVKGNKMTATAGEATSFNIIDIGAGIIALQGGDNFLKYAQNEMKYDLKFDNTAATVESARWCMKPVQKAKTAGDGEMALEIATRDGGDKHRYATFYAPFDILLTDAAKDTAYVVVKWPTITGTTAVMHPKRIGQYNTAENLCPESYRGNDQFIPANTPVIIRTTNTTNHVTAVMPTATPSKSVSCVFTGTYLEQMLAQDAGNLIYVFGRSYTHSGDFTYNSSTGEVTPAGLDFDKGVGFYQNANTNRESNETKTQWTRNNKYVYANKVYYRGAIAASGSSSLNIDFENTEYIPVLFDDQGVKDMDLQPDGTMRLRINDGRAYDIQGRCVATEQEVSDGSWLNNVASGMYIVNGKKFVIE